MRICAVSHFGVPFHIAGSETVLHNTLRVFVEDGHQVQMLTTDDVAPEHWNHDGVCSQGFASTEELIAHLVTSRPDVVITQHHLAHDVLPVARSIGARTILLVHMEQEMAEELFEAPTLGADLTVFNAQRYADRFPHHYGRIAVIPPIVHMTEHRATPGGCVTLMTVRQYKGSDLFYALAERMPEYPFLAVKGGYLPEMDDVRILPNVEVREHTDNVREHVWARTKVLLAPSAGETWNLSVAEACFSGIPVIANDVPGLREPLGGAGIFIDRDRIDTWEVMLRMLLEDQNLWSGYQRRAQHRAMQLEAAAEITAQIWLKWLDWVGTLGERPN